MSDPTEIFHRIISTIAFGIGLRGGVTADISAEQRAESRLLWHSGDVPMAVWPLLLAMAVVYYLHRLHYDIDDAIYELTDPDQRPKVREPSSPYLLQMFASAGLCCFVGYWIGSHG